MHTAQELIDSSINLVTLPAVYISVKRVVDDPNARVEDLAQVISADPGMTARVLKLINSSFWGVSGKVDSLTRAIALLGMNPVHDLVLATSVVAAFDRMQPGQMDSARFWQGSVFRALAATALARQCALKGKPVDLGRMFTLGLMSDLGHMVMYIKVPELAAQALAQTEYRPWALAATERELIGCDFAQVGAALTDSWQLPSTFGMAIGHQCKPQQAGAHGMAASLLHLCATLAELGGTVSDNLLLIEQIEPFAWEATGLDPSCLPLIIPEVEINLMATSQMFGIHLADR
jgi:HD-like signal output (HDOD) protein